MKEELVFLVNELRKLSSEVEWLEFKHNKYRPDMIGEDICALANGAAIVDKDCAYMIWGIDDKSHEVVGTDLDFRLLKKGNQELIDWLRIMLSKNADFYVDDCYIDGKKLVILTINRALNTPVTFSNIAYIRSGSNTKKLKDFPALEAKLWRQLNTRNFEDVAIAGNLSLNDVFEKLNVSAYFTSLGISQPSTFEGASHYLIQDGLIQQQDNGLYSVTNLGALLLAYRFSSFGTLYRKALRVVQYAGDNKIKISRDQIFDEGYVLCFNDALRYIGGLLPSEERLEGAALKAVSPFSLEVVREALANALIHQQLNITGASVVVEIFSNRIEITNPGAPLVDIKRIVDNPPKSRNEKLSSMMRRMKFCEELGSGWDRIVLECENRRSPAPRIDVYMESTRVVIFGQIPYSDMKNEERLWSCYLHACLMFLSGKFLTNKSLRERFGVEVSSSASISRLIRQAMSQNLIKPLDPDSSPKFMKYVPYWA